MVSSEKINLLVRVSLTIMMGIAISVGSFLAQGAAEKVTKRNLKQKIGSATTAADHKAIADYYHAQAAEARAKGNEHEQMALAYEKAGVGKYGKSPSVPFTHCQSLAQKYKSLAEDLTALAKEHETMAAKAK